MNFQILLSKAPITLIFIMIFVAVSGYQVVQGGSLDEPTSRQLLDFGANFLPLSLGDEPWRIILSAFLHIGLIHLLFNAFAMYYFGQVVEQIVGRWRFIALFVLSAIGGNLLNLYITWQDVLSGQQIGLSAGASGGIMGIGATLLVLALAKAPMPFYLNTKNLAMVMAINLFMGFAIAGIDNAAHIGGAVAGGGLSCLWSFIAKGKISHIWFWVFAVVMSVGLVAVWWYLHEQLLAVM